MIPSSYNSIIFFNIEYARIALPILRDLPHAEIVEQKPYSFGRNSSSFVSIYIVIVQFNKASAFSPALTVPDFCHASITKLIVCVLGFKSVRPLTYSSYIFNKAVSAFCAESACFDFTYALMRVT
eukprot:Pompholyxophrys_punicea_v1_NODE_6_length_8794_cov_7.233894.p9 type:complete len:125 gc:universal NODE_6_length_8794_cov_7.233894:2912-3286(+)